MITVYVLLNSFGQILIKTGTPENMKGLDIRELLNIRLLSGALLFGLSFLAWIFILSKTNLSYSFPFAVGFGYTSVIVLSYFILKEDIAPLQILGIIIVGLGLTLIFLNRTSA